MHINVTSFTKCTGHCTGSYCTVINSMLFIHDQENIISIILKVMTFFSTQVLWSINIWDLLNCVNTEVKCVFKSGI